MLLRDAPKTHEILAKLQELGVRIALDDFGTAFASLSYLQSFPFDKIKIDRSFVREVPERADCLAIVRAVTNLARNLHIETVAEGIETREHFTTITEAGLRRGAGLLFQPPRAVERCRRGAGALPPQMPGDGASSLARPQPDGETGPPRPHGALTSQDRRPPSKEAAGGSTTRRPWRSHSGSASVLVVGLSVLGILPGRPLVRIPPS